MVVQMQPLLFQSLYTLPSLQDPWDHVQNYKIADDRLGDVAEYSGRSSDSPYPTPFREGMSTAYKPSCDDLEQTYSWSYKDGH